MVGSFEICRAIMKLKLKLNDHYMKSKAARDLALSCIIASISENYMTLASSVFMQQTRNEVFRIVLASLLQF